MPRYGGLTVRRPADCIPPIDAPCLTVYGCSVPDKFTANIDAQMIASGLLARLLVFNERPDVDVADLVAYDDDVVTVPQRRIAELATVAYVDVTFDDDAKRAFHALAKKYASGIGNRGGMVARRVAALMCMYDTLGAHVTAYHANIACRMFDKLTRDMIAAVGESAQGRAATERERVALNAVREIAATPRAVVYLVRDDHASLRREYAAGHELHFVGWRDISERLRKLPLFSGPRGPSREVRDTLRELVDKHMLVMTFDLPHSREHYAAP